MSKATRPASCVKPSTMWSIISRVLAVLRYRVGVSRTSPLLPGATSPRMEGLRRRLQLGFVPAGVSRQVLHRATVSGLAARNLQDLPLDEGVQVGKQRRRLPADPRPGLPGWAWGREARRSPPRRHVGMPVRAAGKACRHGTVHRQTPFPQLRNDVLTLGVQVLCHVGIRPGAARSFHLRPGGPCWYHAARPRANRRSLPNEERFLWLRRCWSPSSSILLGSRCWRRSARSSAARTSPSPHLRPPSLTWTAYWSGWPPCPGTFWARPRS